MSDKRAARLGALQIGSAADTAATVEAVMAHAPEIAAARLDLLVLPEALLGGYPKGADFGARLGYRTPYGREAYRQYHAQAVDLDGPEVGAMQALARQTGSAIVVGVIERAGYSLYCTALFITATGELAGKHRKLMPTATERLVWAQAADAGLTTMDTVAGRVGAAICWENYMPMYRQALYGQGVEVWCAPTVDDRDIWQISMRHIAYEARCFLVSACQVQPPTTQALGRTISLRDRAEDAPMIRGGSMIVSPMGEVLAGPLENQIGLVTAEVDLNDIARARFDMDASGHYARAELFGVPGAHA
ncbi:MAG: carbon-nitrogen hydrolase family protein [Polymorphobacter sp.]